MAEIFTHPIPAVIVLLGVLVLVHEAGHYLVGRLCGIAVETFSIGFGPRIFGWTSNGTDYRVSWIPLGGYVKFAGAHPAEDVPPGLPGRAFREVSLGRRALTIIAGPGANFVLALVAYTTLGLAGIEHPPAIIGEVVPGSPADEAGLRYGDKVLQIGDEPTETWFDLQKSIAAAPGQQLTVGVEREGEELRLELTPEAVEAVGMNGLMGEVGRAGVALGRLPSIIAITDDQGIAAKAGLRTGDRITALDVEGFERPVEYYAAFEDLVQRAIATGSDFIDLKVKRPERLDVWVSAEGESNDMPTPSFEATSIRLPLVSSNEAPIAVLGDLGLGNAQLTIARLEEPVAKALEVGDQVVGWNGKSVANIYELGERLRKNNKSEVVLDIRRAGAEIQVPVTLQPVDTQRPEGKVTIFTLPAMFLSQPEQPDPLVERYANPIAALTYGAKETLRQTGALTAGLWSLISGDVPLKALGGPMLIAKVAGDSAARGWQTFLGAMALISVNLGVLNLFPIPVLDGGQLVLLGMEGVRRRPLAEAAVENFQKVGFALVMALVVLATYNDLSRFWKSMLESVIGIF